MTKRLLVCLLRCEEHIYSSRGEIEEKKIMTPSWSILTRTRNSYNMYNGMMYDMYLRGAYVGDEGGALLERFLPGKGLLDSRGPVEVPRKGHSVPKVALVVCAHGAAVQVAVVIDSDLRTVGTGGF